MKQKLMGMLFSAIFWSFLLSNVQAMTIEGKGFQQMKIGDIDAVVLSDGYIRISPIQPSMAPDITSMQLSDFLNGNDSDTQSIDLAMNILLLKKGDKFILFDSGSGSDMGPTGGWLKDNLAIIGVSPEQITDIVVTHAHMDHIAGLLDSNGKSIYPDANVYMTQIEYDFWMSENPDFSRSKSKDTAMVATMVKYIRNILTTLKPQIKLVADKDILLDCIEVELAPGHTPGHIISTVFSNNEKLVVMADIVHATNILFANPRWGTAFDYDFNLGVETRLDILKKLSATNNTVVFGYHQPYPGIGRIKQIANESYEWVPADFATPQLKD